jgi:hypothetical protein
MVINIVYECHRFIVLGTNPDAAARWLKQNHLGYVPAPNYIRITRQQEYTFFITPPKKQYKGSLHVTTVTHDPR